MLMEREEISEVGWAGNVSLEGRKEVVTKGELFGGASLICGLHCGLPPYM